MPHQEPPAIDVRDAGDRVEIHVHEDVDLASQRRIESVVEREVRRGAVHVVLDFCSSKFVGGPGVRVALGALRVVSRRGGTVIVRGRHHVQRLFHITGAAEQVDLEDCP